MTTTLAELIDQIRFTVDSTNDASLTDAELTTQINSSLGKFQGKLVSIVSEDWWEDAYTITTEDGTAYYDLPSDFYKLNSIEVSYNGYNYKLKPFTKATRTFNQATGLLAPGYKYRLTANQIEINPTPQSSFDINLRYVPVISKLVNDEDAVDAFILDSWLEWVVVDVAIKILIRRQELSEVQVQKTRLSEIEQNIHEFAVNRDLGRWDKIINIYDRTDEVF